MQATSTPQIDGNDWYLYDERGLLQEGNVRVRRYGDGTVTIGCTAHRLDDLLIEDNRITPIGARWTVLRGDAQL